ncbi:MAG TPA: hypothetical protein VF085_09680 [Solirubrobacterales bacterium]
MQTSTADIPHKRTYRDEVVAWRLIDAEWPDVAEGVFDEGVDATVERVRRWRAEAGAECYRDADEILNILTRPVGE